MSIVIDPMRYQISLAHDGSSARQLDRRVGHFALLDASFDSLSFFLLDPQMSRSRRKYTSGILHIFQLPSSKKNGETYTCARSVSNAMHSGGFFYLESKATFSFVVEMLGGSTGGEWTYLS